MPTTIKKRQSPRNKQRYKKGENTLQGDHDAAESRSASTTLLCARIPDAIEIDPRVTASGRSIAGSSLSGPGSAPRALETRLWNRIRNGGKDLCDIRAVFRARLKEQEILLVGVGFCLARRHLSRVAAGLVLVVVLRLLLIRTLSCSSSSSSEVVGLGGICGGVRVVAAQIGLVAAQGYDDARTGLSLQLGDPVAGLDQRTGLGEIVDDEGGLGVAVVHWSQRGEALLARRVPDFKLDLPRRESDFLGQKRRADGGFFVGLEVVVYKAEHE